MFSYELISNFMFEFQYLNLQFYLTFKDMELVQLCPVILKFLRITN